MNHYYAFARGYYDARTEGLDRNPWADYASLSPEIERQRAAYSDGYECGISDYCAEHHPEEVNQ